MKRGRRRNYFGKEQNQTSDQGVLLPERLLPFGAASDQRSPIAKLGISGRLRTQTGFPGTTHEFEGKSVFPGLDQKVEWKRVGWEDDVPVD